MVSFAIRFTSLRPWALAPGRLRQLCIPRPPGSIEGLDPVRLLCRQVLRLAGVLGGVPAGTYFSSKKERDSPDCLTTASKVPTRISSWSGTGTVTVVSGVFFCMMM